MTQSPNSHAFATLHNGPAYAAQAEQHHLHSPGMPDGTARPPVVCLDGSCRVPVVAQATEPGEKRFCSMGEEAQATEPKEKNSAAQEGRHR
eukprot:1156448-Pelagomonas_calceolata.AAC.2